ncbi:MAG: helix-hairpin-helix domain-containing protein [Lachnospiraceae bacterium]|nr:helix-hairpin-helix domain-containing protein [Lachnospiraceae bacterium]
MCGQVVEEGVFFVVKGARIADAVDAAGGFTDDAAVRALNLAMPVTDGMQIYVPTVEEAETGRYRPPNAEVGEAVRLVNINTADAATLMTLPGIGEQKAKDIVAYRSAHGKFAEASDIMNVSGIKSAVFERIKDQICTE